MSNTIAQGRWLDWAQVDVFADAPFQGNMLAIFPDATGLTTAQMQSLARETNLSETTFVFPRDAATGQAEGVRVRIFTTEEELPFAGHPTLGTASWLRIHRPGLAGAERITLVLNVGPIAVDFPRDLQPPHVNGIMARMVQRDPQFAANLDGSFVASLLHLDEGQISGTLRPQVVSTGLPFLIAPLASLHALDAIQPDRARLASLFAETGAKFLYALAQADDLTWHARMPFYNGEDPATGSAAGCAISYLVHHGAAPAGQDVTVLQGQHVHRPSRIVCQASLRGGQVHGVRIAGCTIPVASGRFMRP